MVVHRKWPEPKYACPNSNRHSRSSFRTTFPTATFSVTFNSLKCSQSSSQPPSATQKGRDSHSAEERESLPFPHQTHSRRGIPCWRECAGGSSSLTVLGTLRRTTIGHWLQARWKLNNADQMRHKKRRPRERSREAPFHFTRLSLPRGLPSASHLHRRGLCDLARRDAPGAHPDPAPIPLVIDDLHRLKVRQPTAPRLVVRVADVVSRSGSLATRIAHSSHLYRSLLEICMKGRASSCRRPPRPDRRSRRRSALSDSGSQIQPQSDRSRISSPLSPRRQSPKDPSHGSRPRQ